MAYSALEDRSIHVAGDASAPLKSSGARDRLALDAIYEIARSFCSAPDPMEVIPRIMDILTSYLDLQHSVLALLAEPGMDDQPGRVNPYRIAATSFSRKPDEPAEDALPDAIARAVFRTGVPLVSFDLAHEFGAQAVPRRLRGCGQTAIAVPLRDPDQSHFVLGVLCAFRAHDTRWSGQSDLDVRVMTMVASLMQQALHFRRQIARDRARAQEDARRMLQSAREQSARPEIPVSLAGIIGDSPAIIEVIDQVKRVAGTNAPVLLRGESGTGKELFARAVHTESERRKGPFVRVNCAALSETLLESELFGHEKGAFTGANALKKGRFELSDGGTLFLDEIGEISPTFQTKLLRVLQEGEFERVGGTRTIKVDVRLVAATNRDLEAAVACGEFRADLYFRICVVPIRLPPLRERKSDIRPLAQLFLDQFNKDNGTDVRFATDAFETICHCSFPGNVRELENCVHRAAALSDGEIVLGEELACQQGSCLSSGLWRMQNEGSSPVGGLAVGSVVTPTVRAPSRSVSEDSAFGHGDVRQPEPAPAHDNPVPSSSGLRRRKTANTAREELIAAMEEAGWVQAKAARLLGMTPRQIAYALQKHGIEIRKI